MSRSGYNEDYDCEDNSAYLYRGAVDRAMKGKRGQAFLKEMLQALDALPEKKLIDYDLQRDGAFCAIGTVGNARGVDMSELDPENTERVAATFGIATSMVREIVYMNDEATEGPAFVQSCLVYLGLATWWAPDARLCALASGLLAPSNSQVSDRD